LRVEGRLTANSRKKPAAGQVCPTTGPLDTLLVQQTPRLIRRGFLGSGCREHFIELVYGCIEPVFGHLGDWSPSAGRGAGSRGGRGGKRPQEGTKRRENGWNWIGGVRSSGLSLCRSQAGQSCQVSNLYLCSSAQSHQRSTARGKAAGTAKLTEDDVRSILALRGVLIQREVAARYWISRQTVSDIWCGRSWRHLRRDTP
jgi:hypothetical protein